MRSRTKLNFPAPLIPAECDLQDFNFMPVEIERLRKSKAWLRARRVPFLAFFLFNMWMRAYHELPAGSIDNDDDTLADAAGCPPADWAAAKDDVLRGWVLCSNNRWYHPVVAEKVLIGWAARLKAKYRSKAENRRKAIYRAKQDEEPVPAPIEPFNVWLKENYPESASISDQLFPDEKASKTAESDDLSRVTNTNVRVVSAPGPAQNSPKGEGEGEGELKEEGRKKETSVYSAPTNGHTHGPASGAAQGALAGHPSTGEFDKWWQACKHTVPRGSSKPKALRRWTQLPLADTENMIEAWHAYIQARRDETASAKFPAKIHHPENWFKDRIYADFLDAVLERQRQQQQRSTERHTTIQRWGGMAPSVITAIGEAKFDAWLLGSTITVTSPLQADLHIPKPFAAKYLRENPAIIRSIETTLNVAVTIISGPLPAKAATG